MRKIDGWGTRDEMDREMQNTGMREIQGQEQ
jgi:hypothetical protein